MICGSLIFAHYLYLHMVILAGILLGGGDVAEAAGGSWDLLQRSIGVSAMHMQLLNNDRVIIFDRTDFGRSNLSLPDGKCRNDPNDIALKVDCTAHSVEYNVAANAFRPLMVLTDTWCSSGAVSANGQLIQTGGWNDGDRAVRIISPCNNSCDWEEYPAALTARRWYATNQILPDGRTVFILGGRRQFNYEFHPKTNGTASGVYSLPFLVQTKDPEENNLYPFVHLNVDGNLFIFSNNRAILFDYRRNVIIRTYPKMPGGEPRNYPSSGSSVLLPLKNLNSNSLEAEVLICGGAPVGSYNQATKNNFMEAVNTCGRLKITDPSGQWEMETMPAARVMGDMLLLPSGDVLIINGASAGTAGWEYGRNPVLNPVIYKPDNPSSSRFEMQNPSKIPRLYHSTAILLRDGRVLVGGSNPHVGYSFAGFPFPTELSLEAFSPPYLDTSLSNSRPIIDSPKSPSMLNYGRKVGIQFRVGGKLSDGGVLVALVAPSFTTHSFSMNQRLLHLVVGNPTAVSPSAYNVDVETPTSGVLAPAGYYLLFIVNGGIPSKGIWVHIE